MNEENLDAARKVALDGADADSSTIRNGELRRPKRPFRWTPSSERRHVQPKTGRHEEGHEPTCHGSPPGGAPSEQDGDSL